MYAINDPLGQTNNSASSDHSFNFKIVLFCKILKVGADGRTSDMCENSDHHGRDCGLAKWINKSKRFTINYWFSYIGISLRKLATSICTTQTTFAQGWQLSQSFL